MSIVSYDEQIYLLAYWIRTNIIGVEEKIAEGRHAELHEIVRHQLADEFEVEDQAVIDAILESWDVQ